MDYIFESLLVFVFFDQVSTQWSLDQVCYKSFYLDRVHPAPNRCPPNDYFSYYSCCDTMTDLCCRRPREILLAIIVIIILIFICFLGCCVFGFLFKFFERQKEKKPKIDQKDVEAQTEKRSESQSEISHQEISQDHTIRAYNNLGIETKC